MSHHALAGSLRLESKAAPDATDWTLRKEDSAQQGVSSLPLHAQIIACSLNSDGEGGSQKQIRESACQFRRIDSAFCVYVNIDEKSRGLRVACVCHWWKLHRLRPRQRMVSRAHTSGEST